jgi:long-chain fatty acid transport protein
MAIFIPTPPRAGLLVIAFAAVAAARADAQSGFARDVAARDAGRAGAGFARADSPSAIGNNPAAAAFLKYRQVEVGARAALPFVNFTGEDPFPGSIGTESVKHTPSLAPAFHYTHTVSDRLTVGLGVDEPFALDYRWAEPEAFSGRFLTQRSSLHSVSVMPLFAYKLADRLAIGAYLDVRRTSFRMDRNVAGIHPFTQQAVDAAALSTGRADTTKLSGGFGLLARPSDAFAVAFSYRHKVSASFEGQATLVPIPTGNTQVDARFAQLFPGVLPYSAEIHLPARAGLGLSYDWEAWTLVADVDWTDWSSFGGGPVVFASRPELSSDLAGLWRDVFSLRVGLEHPVNEQWTVRGGYAFAESPVTRESLSPFAPELRRHVAALGATWTSGSWHIDLANTLALQPSRSTAGTSALLYDGSYKGMIDTFSVAIGYRY